MKRTTLFIAALTFAGCTDAAAPPQLVETELASARSGSGTVTTLPTFGGGAVAEAINDAGVVVGAASEAQPSRYVAGTSYPARWIRNEAGAWTVKSLGAPGATALSVNEAGEAVGVRTGNAIFWSAAGDEISLGVGAAEGINNAGVIVGGSTWGGVATTVPYAWTPNAGTSPMTFTRHELPLLDGGGGASATAINEDSVIAGGALQGGQYRAVVWKPKEGGGWSAPIPLYGTEASRGSSSGFAINDNGDVAGYSRPCPAQENCGGSRPYLWPAGGGSVNLASSISNVNAGLAYGISNDVRVVGLLSVTHGNGGGPFSWNPATTALTDLGDGQAKDINNGTGRYGREAVGSASGSKGQRAFVWRIP